MQIFDEVNNINYKKRGIPFEEYFNVMEIPEEDKRKRIEVARKLKDAIDFLFYLILFYDSVDLLDTDNIKNQFMDRYIQAIIDYVVIDEYIKQHIEDMANDIISSTIDNIDNACIRQRIGQYLMLRMKAMWYSIMRNYKKQSQWVRHIRLGTQCKIDE